MAAVDAYQPDDREFVQDVSPSRAINGIRLSVGSASFDAAAVKQQFPGLGDPQLHYLDSAATAQMPEAVFNALRRFA
jgi:hypothetical protein